MRYVRLDNDPFRRSAFLQALMITTIHHFAMKTIQKLTNLVTHADRLHQLDTDTMSANVIALSELLQVIAKLREEINTIKRITNATPNTGLCCYDRRFRSNNGGKQPGSPLKPIGWTPAISPGSISAIDTVSMMASGLIVSIFSG